MPGDAHAVLELCMRHESIILSILCLLAMIQACEARYLAKLQGFYEFRAAKMDTDCKFCDSLIPLSRWIIALRGCFTGSRDRFQRLCSLGGKQVEKAADSNVAVKLPPFLRRQLPLLVLNGRLVHLFSVLFGKA